MKLMKKIVSIVCALGMVATMTTALVTQAATAPTLKVEVKNWDADAKTGTMYVYVNGLDKSVESTDLENFFFNLAEVEIPVPSASFDETYYASGKGGGNYAQNVFVTSALTGAKAAYTNEAIKVSWTVGVTNSSINSGDKSAPNAYNGSDMSSFELIHFNFKLDEADSYQVTNGVVLIGGTQFNNEWSDAGTFVKWGNNGETGVQTMTYDLPVIGNSATPTPTATATAEPVVTPEPTPVAPTPTPVVTPEPTPVAPTEGNGAITTEQSGSENDAAVWAWKELTGNGNAVTVTIDTGAVNAAVKSKTFTLGADVEGTAKVGIVIQYDPTVFTSGVSVTSMSLATAN